MSAVLQQPEVNEELHVAVRMTPEVQREVAATGALAVAQAYDVDCAEMAQSLADDRRAWAKRIDRLEAMKKDLIAPAKEALEKMRERLARWFDAPLQDLTAARDLAGQKLLTWETAERERVAREKAVAEAEARRIRQEVEAKAAAERARAEEIAREARRKAEEAEAARRKAEAEGNARAAAAAAAAAARAQEQARAAIETGEARAQELQMRAAATATAPVSEPVKIDGQSVKDNWVAELRPGVTIDQAKELIVAAIPTQGRRDLLAHIHLDTAPRGSLNKLAAALKGAMDVPGFVAVNRQQLAGARK